MRLEFNEKRGNNIMTVFDGINNTVKFEINGEYKWLNENEVLNLTNVLSERQSSTEVAEKPDSKALHIADVSNSLVADIRNKLTPVKNLCAILKNRDVEPYMEKDDKLNKIVNSEIEKTLEVIEWLSNL